jgi:hypothetical protein
MEAVRNLKVNLKLAGQPCTSCTVPLEIGEDAAICTGCEAAHHGKCWESRGGCGTAGCVNAPLKRLDAAAGSAAAAGAARVAVSVAPAGMMPCPHCGQMISLGTPFCAFCRGITSPDGLYHGPLTNAPGAVASLVFGIIGLFVCGIIFGPIAISKANQAKRDIAANPTYGGGGLATAGLVMGIIDIVAWAFLLVARASSASQ